MTYIEEYPAQLTRSSDQIPWLGGAELVLIAPTSVIGRANIDAIPALFHEAVADTDSANMLMRLFYILSALGQDEQAAEMQEKALMQRCVYRLCDPPQPSYSFVDDGWSRWNGRQYAGRFFNRKQ
ncbi:hypothetical protein ACO0LB_02185 [Undibacterium sp. SXout7W]|uniref:hypothetical protein n=1 Tax=Undibacterium sp. SXout7W TaxID=3413049 RepID=UPI003BEFFD14